VGAIDAAIARRPLALGLSLQDSHSAVHAMTLAVMARRRGFQGYIVAGGPFATLQTSWVLDRLPAVDGVIRHQGEQSLIALIQALARAGDLGTIPGLVTREHANPPAPEQAQQSWRPLRGPLPRVMGVPTAHVLAGKGCHHRCDYCTHAALASLVVRECRDAGATPEELRRAGLGRPARRPVADLAAEMGELFHEHGVRYFEIIDESPLPHGEAAALAWIASLRQHLDRNRVGEISFGMLVRGDLLTRPVARALADLGLVRTFVGVDSGHDSSLRALGRRGDAEAGHRGLRLLSEHGVLPSFNVLIVQPDSTGESIAAEIEAVARTRGAVFETVHVRPHVGTRLHERLASAGRIKGGSLSPSFVVPDPVAERFRLLTRRLATEAIGQYSTSFQALDLILSTTLAARYTSNPRAEACDQRARGLVDAITAARVDAARELLAAAMSGTDASEVIARAAARFRAQRREMDAVARLLQGVEPNERGRLARHYRNLAAAASLVFTVAGSAACNQHRVLGDSGSDSGSSAGPDTAATASGGDDGTHGGADDGTGGDSESSTEDDPDVKLDVMGETSDSTGCDASEDRSRLNDLVYDNCGFYDGPCSISVTVTLDANGRVQAVQVDEMSGECPSDWLDETTACYLELLEGEEFPCLAGEEVWIGEVFPGGLGD